MNNLSKKLMFFMLLMLSAFSFAQAVTEQFLVKGNCNMCKARIETAATKAGAISANWSAENQTLTGHFLQERHRLQLRLWFFCLYHEAKLHFQKLPPQLY